MSVFDLDHWQEIKTALLRNRTRTALTAFGVFWGIFMLTVLLGAGRGLQKGVDEGFPRITNTVYVWSKDPTQIPWQGMPVGRQIRLKPSDVEAIKKKHPQMEIYTYPAGHGFNCDERGSFHEPSAKLAWERTLAFFAKNLTAKR